MRANGQYCGMVPQFPIWPRTALTQLELVPSLVCLFHLSKLGFAPIAIRICVMLNDSEHPMELMCLMLFPHSLLMKLEHRASQTANKSQAPVFSLQI